MIELDIINNHIIPSNEINDRLTTIYNQLPDECFSAIENYNAQNTGHTLTNPFYIAMSNECANAESVVMIAGQETFTWGSEITKNKDGAFSRDSSPCKLQIIFDLFCNNPNRDSHSPYWTFFEKCREYARESKTGFISNNLSKVGFINNEPGNDFNVSVKWGQVLCAEIEVCDPDMIIFTTGPSYDQLLQAIFGNFIVHSCIEGVGTRKLAKLEFKDGILKGRRIYRTYHPAFLQRSKNRYSWINQIYEFIFTLFNQ